MKLKLKALLTVIITLAILIGIGVGGMYVAYSVPEEIRPWILLGPAIIFCTYLMYKGAYYYYEGKEKEKKEEKEQGRPLILKNPLRIVEEE